MAEGETRGDWLPVSCRPPVEWERNHSLPSSWLACRDDGVYLQNSTARTLKHIYKGKAIPGQENNWEESTISDWTTISSRLILIRIAQFFQMIWHHLFESHRKRGIWEENYASVRHKIENHKQWADSQVNWEGPKVQCLKGCKRIGQKWYTVIGQKPREVGGCSQKGMGNGTHTDGHLF